MTNERSCKKHQNTSTMSDVHKALVARKAIASLLLLGHVLKKNQFKTYEPPGCVIDDLPFNSKLLERWEYKIQIGKYMKEQRQLHLEAEERWWSQLKAEQQRHNQIEAEQRELKAQQKRKKAQRRNAIRTTNPIGHSRQQQFGSTHHPRHVSKELGGKVNQQGVYGQMICWVRTGNFGFANVRLNGRLVEVCVMVKHLLSRNTPRRGSIVSGLLEYDSRRQGMRLTQVHIEKY